MNLDRLNWKILQYLQREGRSSLKQLGQKIGLSLPAASERVKKLEEAGVICGYRAEVYPESVGYAVTAQIGITAPQPLKEAFLATLDKMPEVLECLHVTGNDSYLLRVVARDLQHLEAFVGEINHFGETRTSIVLSQPIRRRAVAPVVDKP
ncbi:MAG: Lrp/AsnC family transcriptional regulator [Pseudomonadales bacterium]